MAAIHGEQDEPTRDYHRRSIGIGGQAMKLQRKVGLVGLFTAVLYLGNLGVALPADAHGTLPSMQARGPEHVDHVLLLSIDGMHEADLERLVQTEPRSALAWLTHRAVQYKHAATTKPSDSFPGLLSMVTGGTPRTTGVYYDDSYDRTLAPAGSDCSQRGTEVAYDESLDKNPNALDAGGGIDPSTLPRDPAHGCTPLYPHQYLRVNTIFEVVKAAGGHTAWADKHPAYEILNGPSGKGVDDLFTPEIAADGITDSVAKTEAYDDRKVQAILNEIGGRDHTGRRKVGVPTLFGMNFQAVSVAQKLPGGGYRDAAGTPSGMQRQVQDHTDRSIGR
ncbi:MAG TPA: alkaline phosphatase family protein, partial [Herpetosiphonaceae bacterium]|nr:alkaline phosphatase family protein [Herpetosiphonaceae bacterium]